MEATLANGVGLRSDSPRFYLRMAAMFVLIAFSGFIPTYSAKLAHGTFHVPLFSVLVCSILATKVVTLRSSRCLHLG